MSSSLVKLTAEIVSSHASGSPMSSDDLILEIDKVFATLKRLETGETVVAASEAPAGPALSMKKAFQNDQVGCMICGKIGFKTLARHLRIAHELKPGQYRRQFNIPSSQSLTAKNYSEARRNAANENNLAANLEKARAVRAAKKAPAAKAASLTVPVAAPAEKPVKEKKSAITAKAVKKTTKARSSKTPAQ